jgi:hypothetical protein
MPMVANITMSESTEPRGILGGSHDTSEPTE